MMQTGFSRGLLVCLARVWPWLRQIRPRPEWSLRVYRPVAALLLIEAATVLYLRADILMLEWLGTGHQKIGLYVVGARDLIDLGAGSRFGPVKIVRVLRAFCRAGKAGKTGKTGKMAGDYRTRIYAGSGTWRRAHPTSRCAAGWTDLS